MMSENFKYVIVGNSAAGLNALESIRRVDSDSSAAIISQEGQLAFSRMLLPYYVEGRIGEDKLFIRDADYYRRLGAESILGRVTSVDLKAKSIYLEDGVELGYDKLLVATGASPIVPQIKGIDRENVFTFWTLDDARNVISAAGNIKNVAIIGAGLIGVQSSHALANRDIHFTVIDIADQILPRILDADGARMVQEMIEGDKVDIITGADITEIAPGTNGHPHSIQINNNKSVAADLIIVGAGAAPNFSFIIGQGNGEGTDIATDAGILVNNAMETNIPDVYAAGDVAQGHDALTGEQVVRGIWPTAAEQGAVAGYNMAGRPMEYQGSLSTNVVDFFGVTVASVGKTSEEEGLDVETYIDSSGAVLRKVFTRDGVIQGASLIGRYSDAGILQWLVRMKADIGSWKGTVARRPLNMGRMMLSIKEVDLGPHWPLPLNR